MPTSSTTSVISTPRVKHVRFKAPLINKRQRQQDKRRSFSPISRLPAEVLSIIFTFAKFGRGISPRVFCQVSKDWYFVATTTPRLWTAIVMTPFRPLCQLDIMLKRSRPLSIDLVLDFRHCYTLRPFVVGDDKVLYMTRHHSMRLGFFSDPECVKAGSGAHDKEPNPVPVTTEDECQLWHAQARGILRHENLARCRSITVQGQSCHAILAAISILKCTKDYRATHLQRFEMDTQCDPTRCNLDVPWLTTNVPIPAKGPNGTQGCRFAYMHLLNASFFQKGAPRLTHVSFSALSIPCTYIPFDFVHTLSLSANGRWTHSTHLAALLARFPKLQNLHFHDDTSLSWLTPGASPISLPRLRTLRFTGDNFELGDALSRLYTPNLQHLILEDLHPHYLETLPLYQSTSGNAVNKNKYPVLKKLTLCAVAFHTSVSQRVFNHALIDDLALPPKMLSAKHNPGPSYSNDVLKGCLYGQTIHRTARCFPNIEELVISESLIGDSVYALTPHKGMDNNGNYATAFTWIAWQELRSIRVLAGMPHWEMRLALHELLKKRKTYGVPIDAVKIDYRGRQPFWHMDDLIEN